MSRESCIKVLQDVFERDMACVGITLTHEALEAVIEYLKDVPSADVTHWIPCSEQMPPMDEYVLVCTVDGDITDGQRWDEDDDGTWFIFGDSHSASDGDIVAWMPLPEPYEEGETNEQ